MTASRLLIVWLLAVAVQGYARSQNLDCYGASVKVRLLRSENTSSASRVQFAARPSSSPSAVYGYPAGFGTPLQVNETGPYSLTTIHPTDGCNNALPPPSESLTPPHAALVARGNCSFVDKARYLESAGYKLMILYDVGTDLCVFMGNGNASSAGEVHLSALSVTATAASVLADLAVQRGAIAVSQPAPRVFDPSEVVLWIGAVGTITLGALWTGVASERCAGVSGSLIPSPRGLAALAGGEETAAIISTRAAASFVFIASAMLLFMFYFLSAWLAWALVLAFALASHQACSIALASAMRALCPATWHTAVVRPPRPFRRCCGPLHVLPFAANSAATSITLTWLIFRNTHWGWLFQDLLAIALMTVILRTVHLPDLKVASILLCSALLYDVWWVFLQPLVTGGPSVMVDVATGGSDGALRVPIALLAPQFWGLGSNKAMTVLGLGDVVLPGMLCVLCKRWDVARKFRSRQGVLVSPGEDDAERGQQQQQQQRSGAGEERNASKAGGFNGLRCRAGRWCDGSYFWPAVGAYGAGLIVTYVALMLAIGGDQGQPALLWLVPATLGVTCMLAWIRGELRELWSVDKDSIESEQGGERDERAALLGGA